MLSAFTGLGFRPKSGTASLQKYGSEHTSRCCGSLRDRAPSLVQVPHVLCPLKMQEAASVPYMRATNTEHTLLGPSLSPPERGRDYSAPHALPQPARYEHKTNLLGTSMSSERGVTTRNAKRNDHSQTTPQPTGLTPHARVLKSDSLIPSTAGREKGQRHQRGRGGYSKRGK